VVATFAKEKLEAARKMLRYGTPDFAISEWLNILIDDVHKIRLELNQSGHKMNKN
jgi:hypothetical protein